MGIRGWAVIGAGLFVACFVWVPESRGQQLQGFGQLQFQEIEGNGVKRQSWVSILQVDHATRWRERVDFRSQLELRRFEAIDGPERSVVPRGSLQLAHSDFGVNAFYRPSRTTDALGLTTRQNEAVVSGYLTRPGLPRADFNWTRRHRNAGSSTGREVTGITRNAHLSQALGPLNLQVGYGDIEEAPRDSRLRRTTQRNYDGTATLNIATGPRGSASSRYSYSHNTGILASGSRVRTITHETATSGALLLSRMADLSLNYNYRRSELEGQARDRVNDHDGTLLLNMRPSGGVRLSAGGGVRTSRTAETEDVLGNLLLIASADGRVRPGWRGLTSVSHTVSWFPDGRTFTVNTWRGNSRFEMNRRLDLNADVMVSATGDTAASNRRVVLQANYGINALPLPGIRAAWSNRLYRVGPDIGRASAHSIGSTLDLRWQPIRSLEWGGSLSESSPLARGGSKLRTRQMNLRVAAGPRFQLDTTWSRSDQARGDVGTAELVGREIIGSRAHLVLARLLRLSIGFNVADPGRRATRVRQFDFILTQNFGR